MTDEPLPTGYALRRLDASDLPALRALYGAIAAALPDPNSYRLYGGAEAFFASHCCERGESLGIFDASGLVAYGSLTFPTATDCDNYANDLGWAAARASSVALLSAAMVAPGARGLGLHGALIRARLDRAARLGKKEALARAAPHNARSRRNLLHAGFAIVWVGLQAEGSLRHIYWRPTDRAVWPGSPGDGPPPVWADPMDLPAQTLLLSEGRAGVRARESDGWIGFAPLAA
jgi:GNAT superfamily N-acetyltransferase